jgi:hypothetical protein
VSYGRYPQQLGPSIDPDERETRRIYRLLLDAEIAHQAWRIALHIEIDHADAWARGDGVEGLYAADHALTKKEEAVWDAKEEALSNYIERLQKKGRIVTVDSVAITRLREIARKEAARR